VPRAPQLSTASRWRSSRRSCTASEATTTSNSRHQPLDYLTEPTHHTHANYTMPYDPHHDGHVHQHHADRFSLSLSLSLSLSPNKYVHANEYKRVMTQQHAALPRKTRLALVRPQLLVRPLHLTPLTTFAAAACSPSHHHHHHTWLKEVARLVPLLARLLAPRLRLLAPRPPPAQPLRRRRLVCRRVLRRCRRAPQLHRLLCRRHPLRLLLRVAAS